MSLNDFTSQYQEPPKKKNEKLILKFQQLLKELSDKEIPESTQKLIIQEIDKVNQAQSEKIFTATLSKSFRNILKIAEKDSKLVGKNHYRNMWLAIGMSVFGIPFGLAFGAALGNFGFIGIGLPIGFGVGIAIGTNKDKEAFEQGRQLNVEV